MENDENEVFNLGSGNDYTINEFARYVCEAFDHDFNLIEHDLTKYVGVKEKSLDTTKVIKHYTGGDYLKTSLKDGIKEVVNWYINNK